MKYLLGLDISTTASKALLVSEEGDVVATASTAHRIARPRPLWSEQDPEDWWEATQQSVSRAVSEAGLSPGSIKGIGLTGQMHGLVMLDDAGDVIRPAILWDDQRAAEECDVIRDRLGLEALVAETGNDAFPGFTLPKLLWVREHEPERYARLAQVLLPKDYIRYRLSGRFATDKAGAGGTLMLGLSSREWSTDILGAFDVSDALLPPTFEGTEVAATVSSQAAAATGLAVGTPIVGGGGDQSAQAVGVGAVDEGVVAVTLGTSGVVFAANRTPACDRLGRAHAFPHALPSMWHMMGVMLSAAGSLAWYHDTFASDTAYEDLVAEARIVAPGADGLRFLPYLSGERTPHADPNLRGAFVGLTRAHGRAHATRAVLEGVAFGLRDNLDLLADVGVPVPEEVRISGGGARSDVWLQIIADVLGRPLVTVEASEGAAMGAAMLAGVGIGVWDRIEDAVDRCVRLGDRTHPSREGTQAYGNVLQHFRKVHTALSPTFR